MITVIDSPCGRGKTQSMITMINENPTKNYIYITPFLDEVERIKEHTKFAYDKLPRFVSPSYKNHKKKYDSLIEYIYDAKDIVSTHSLFSRCTKDLISIIKQNKYTLILDEVMDVVRVLDISKEDIGMLIKYGIAEVNENSELIWKEPNYKYTDRFGDIMDLCKNNHVYVFNNIALIWTFPIEIFTAFQDVYICTYMFDCQIQRYYYDLFNVPYTKKSIVNNEIVDYIEQKDNVDKIHIIDNDKLNSIGIDRYSLSKSWYKNNENKLKFVKNKIYNLVNNVMPLYLNTKISYKDIIWTTFKNYKSKLSGKGYTKSFLPCNIRSTNDYCDRYIVIYMINVFLHPILIKFFRDKGVEIDQDKYALAEMIQFIYRSSIRNNKDIYVYIPSFRMRNLLNKYIGPRICYDRGF